jgi:hypothetical protein
MIAPRRQVGPTPAELSFLAQSARRPWDSIWVAGGTITGRRSPAPGVYEVSQLSLGSEQPLWISADSYDVDAQAPTDEIFHIAVGHDAERGREEYERRWRPRRAELRSAPVNRLPKIPTLRPLKLPTGWCDVVHSAASGVGAGRSSPAFRFSFKRYDSPLMLIVVA